MFKGSFNCNGKVNINDWQLNSSSLLQQNEVDNVLSDRRSLPDLIFNVFDSKLPGINILLNLKHFARCLEAKLKQLDRHEILTDSGKQSVIEIYKHVDFLLLRMKICEFLFYLRNYLQSIKEENFSLKDIADEAEKDFHDLLGTIRRFLCRLRKMPDSTFLYATSNVGNKCNQPEYHMYHIHLDLRWLIISLTYIQNNSWGCLDNKSDDLENIIYAVIGDLIYISLKIFERISTAELKLKTPYTCTCMRELWIMLQIFTDDLSVRGKCKMFWAYVSSILKHLCSNEFNKDIAPFQQNIDLPYCKNAELFCIWLIYHLMLLYGYNKNGGYCNSPSSRLNERQIESSIDIVEKILKAYVNKGGKNGARDEIDEELCIIIPLLHVLNFEWWKPQVQIITLLWECFHRRLDQPFLMQTRGPWSTSSEKKTPIDILDQVRGRIKIINDVSNESSFGLFLRLLGAMLQKHYNRSDLKIWNQIIGRIYSRFSQNKIQEFSESGLFNFITLFITLAVTGDTINVCSAMVNLLPSVIDWSDSVGSKKCCLIWKSKLVVLLLYNEKKLSYQDIAEDYTETANAISCRKDEFSRSMMMWFIDVLRIILTQSDDFGRSEHAFLGGWIDRYLLECSPNRVTILTSVLLQVFDKCNDLQTTNMMGCSLMLNGLWNHVASRVRQMVTTFDLSTKFYENPTKLAVLFTLEACRDPVTAKKYRHSAISLFHHFTTSIIIKDIRITRLYLTLILENAITLEHLRKEILHFNTICIQAWIKCNILNCDVNNETIFLNNYISNLPEITEILKSESDRNEFLNSNESIISFLMILSRNRTNLMSEQQCISFDATCKPFFHNIEKWALQLINEENKDTTLAAWIYKCIGTVIFYCSPILYVKNQLNNTLKTLINKIALPPEQSTQQHITYLAQKIFSKLILGIENLNIKSDISLQTLIRELFERYLPLLIKIEGNDGNSFQVSDTLSKCFLKAKPDFVRLILEILGRNFITIPGGNTVHKHCYLVMLLLRNIIRAGEIYTSDTVHLIIIICVPSILNCYMRVHYHHPHKQQTITLLQDLFLNSYFKKCSAIREKFNEVVWSVLRKFIVSNIKISFEFLSSTEKINFEFFQYLLSCIECMVSECEKNKNPLAAALRYYLNDVSMKLTKSKIQNSKDADF
ncbi:PREDICTED: protein MMS22-like [Ceratosolen solmsi marchali]|uniref:Protein MMS22-like n=1 Tax=Ceratosolen solmsi marchali TaxID=326594 RepID=A0AAJ6YI85_9HYME|nr:PREDICTED: protein MMS22-like [Ceratosolen solmsi marchali]